MLLEKIVKTWLHGKKTIKYRNKNENTNEKRCNEYFFFKKTYYMKINRSWTLDHGSLDFLPLRTRGVQKNSKPKIEPKNKENRTEKPVNRTNFSKKSVWLTEPIFFSGFRLGYSSDYLKIWLTGG